MKARVTKWGNSLAVRIPRVIAKTGDFKEGDTVELNVKEVGRLEIRRITKLLSLTDLVARITRENRHQESISNGSIGKESVDW